MLNRVDGRRPTDIFDPEHDWRWYVIGAVAFSVGGNFASDLLTEWIGDSWLWRVVVCAVCLGLFVPAVYVIRTGWGRIKESRSVRWLIPRPSFPDGAVTVPGRTVLVAFVSGGTSHEVAVKHHLQAGTLHHCWLIHSEKTAKKAEEYAAAMKRLHPTLDFTLRGMADNDIFELKPPFVRYSHVLEHALTMAGRDSIIVDVTGGTALVTVGAIYACLEKNIAAEYVSQSTGKVIPVNIEWKQALHPELDEREPAA